MISIMFNFGSSLGIVAREISSNNEFYKWFKRNTTFLAVFTLGSSVEVEALMLLTSKIGGLKKLDVPISQKSRKLIFWCSFVGFVIEDIAQFGIQVS